jgi:large conductance mechanosensitive channel
MWKEFKEFVFRGNVVDLAVGVMIGAAFGKIVTSLVNDIFMPVLGLLMGKLDVEALFIALNGKHYDTIALAQADKAATLNYGLFLSTVLDFLLMAVCIFILVKLLSKLRNIRKKEPCPASVPDRLCPFCRQKIAEDATRCPYCTSKLDE